MRRPTLAFLSPLLTHLGNRGGFNAHFFFRQSCIVTTSYVISGLKGVITGYLVTRLFPQEMYGAYKFSLSIVGTIGFISLPGIVSTLASLIAQQKEKAPVRSAIVLYCFWCLLGSIAIAGSIVLLPYWNQESLWMLFIVSALLFIPNNAGIHIFSATVKGTERFDRAFYVTTISNVLQVVGVLLVLWLHPSALLLLLCTSAIPSLLYSGSMLFWLREFPSHQTFRPWIRRSISLSLASIPMTLSWYVDGIVVSAYFGLKQLAVLSVALLIPEQMKVWGKEIFPIFFSAQARGKDSVERRKKITKLIGIGTMMTGVVILLYCSITPYIISFLFPKYDAHQIVFLTNVAAITLISMPSTLYTQYLEARGFIKELQWCNWISSIIYVLCIFILIPIWGPLGAIISRGILRFSFGVTGFYMLQTTPLKNE